MVFIAHTTILRRVIPSQLMMQVGSQLSIKLLICFSTCSVKLLALKVNAVVMINDLDIARNLWVNAPPHFCFKVVVGGAYFSELMVLNELFYAYRESSSLESMYSPSCSNGNAPIQKPHTSFKACEHVACFEKRLASWQIKRGHRHISTRSKNPKMLSPDLHPRDSSNQHHQSRWYAKFMSQDKVKAAWKSQQWKSAAPQQHHTTQFSLKIGHPMHSSQSPNQKHLPCQLAYLKLLLPPPEQESHPEFFDRLDGEAICTTALRIKGASSHSGVKANGYWCRLGTSFKSDSSEVCNSLGLLARWNWVFSQWLQDKILQWTGNKANHWFLIRTLPWYMHQATPSFLTGESHSYFTANTEGNVCLDAGACSFLGWWQQSAFFDVRVFYLNALLHRGLQLEACYRCHKREKCWA